MKGKTFKKSNDTSDEAARNVVRTRFSANTSRNALSGRHPVDRLSAMPETAHVIRKARVLSDDITFLLGAPSGRAEDIV
jgi:hypothetical protein